MMELLCSDVLEDNLWKLKVLEQLILQMIHLITNATSDTVFPPVKSPTIALAIIGSEKTKYKMILIENILINFFE